LTATYGIYICDLRDAGKLPSVNKIIEQIFDIIPKFVLGVSRGKVVKMQLKRRRFLASVGLGSLAGIGFQYYLKRTAEVTTRNIEQREKRENRTMNYQLTERGIKKLDVFIQQKFHGRLEFAGAAGIPKDYPGFLLTGKAFTPKTLGKVNKVFPLTEGEDYGLCDDFVTKLARDRVRSKGLNSEEIEAILAFYKAVQKNPKNKEISRSFDTYDDFASWFNVWENEGVNPNSEQYIVYKSYQEKIYALLFGEHHYKKESEGLNIFAVWYLFGQNNALYANSSVGFSHDQKKMISLMENPTILEMINQLYGEMTNLVNEKKIDYIVFELNAENTNVGRSRLRLFHNILQEFKAEYPLDARLRQLDFYSLESVPYFTYSFMAKRLTKSPYRLFAMPFSTEAINKVKNGQIDVLDAKKLLENVYSMYYDYFDTDSKEYLAIKKATAQEVSNFEKSFANQTIALTPISEIALRHIHR
jgi:hypothetical protein